MVAMEFYYGNAYSDVNKFDYCLPLRFVMTLW